jgi:hypothetical protein
MSFFHLAYRLWPIAIHQPKAVIKLVRVSRWVSVAENAILQDSIKIKDQTKAFFNRCHFFFG